MNRLFSRATETNPLVNITRIKGHILTYIIWIIFQLSIPPNRSIQRGSRGVLRQAHRAGAARAGGPERVHGPPAGLPHGLQQRPQLRLLGGAALLPGDGGGGQRHQRARGRELHHLRHPGRRRGPRGPQRRRRVGPGGARRGQHHRQPRRRHSGTTYR
jgi:hypothetical protein